MQIWGMTEPVRFHSCSRPTREHQAPRQKIKAHAANILHGFFSRFSFLLLAGEQHADVVAQALLQMITNFKSPILLDSKHLDNAM